MSHISVNWKLVALAVLEYLCLGAVGGILVLMTLVKKYNRILDRLDLLNTRVCELEVLLQEDFETADTVRPPSPEAAAGDTLRPPAEFAENLAQERIIALQSNPDLLPTTDEQNNQT